MIPDIQMHRFEFMMRYSIGDVLDVGCLDSSQWGYPIMRESCTYPLLIKNIILMDCDIWKNNIGLKFIRGLAEHIPFKDMCFDTIVFGDILEHVQDVGILLQEAKRLTRDRIIITVPNEWKYGRVNVAFETEEKRITRGEDILQFNSTQTIEHASKLCKNAIDNNKFKHIHHVRFFTEKTLDDLIRNNFNMDDWGYHVYNLRYSKFNLCHIGVIIWRKHER